jgi:hypothetical protein
MVEVVEVAQGMAELVKILHLLVQEYLVKATLAGLVATITAHQKAHIMVAEEEEVPEHKDIIAVVDLVKLVVVKVKPAALPDQLYGVQEAALVEHIL